MIQNRWCCIVLVLSCWCTNGAISQDHCHPLRWWPLPLHGSQWLDCWDRTVVREVVVEIPVVQQWIVPMPVYVPQAVDPRLSIQTRSGLQFSPVLQPAGNLENFARKEIAPADRLTREADAYNDGVEIRRRAAVLKASSPEGRMRADRLISAGDQAFADQVFARATARYREAIAKAPDYAESHFRLAHAYVATRQYNLALKSALVALELAGTSARDGFSLEDMYQGDDFARNQQFERLIDASLREPSDGGLQFLIGFTLHYGEDRQAALEFFRRAERITGIHQGYVHFFLPSPVMAEAAARAEKNRQLPREAAK